MQELEIKRRINEKLRSCLKEIEDNGGIVAGGYPRWLTSKKYSKRVKPAGDIDIWVLNYVDLGKVRNVIRKHTLGVFTQRCSVRYNNELLQFTLMNSTMSSPTIQIIFHENWKYKSHKDILDDFDFTCCVAKLNMFDESITVGDRFLEDERNKKLVWNKVPMFNPRIELVASVLNRLGKYSEYNYTMDFEEIWKFISKYEGDKEVLLNHLEFQYVFSKKTRKRLQFLSNMLGMTDRKRLPSASNSYYFVPMFL